MWEKQLLTFLSSRFNSSILSARRENLEGVYDIHTNVMQYPKIMQPTHARWERLPPSDPGLTSKLTKGMSTLRLTNGTSDGEPTTNGDVHDVPSSKEGKGATSTHSTIFPAVPSVFTRRFAIHDVHYESPPF